jgi:hypothetical protein
MKTSLLLTVFTIVIISLTGKVFSQGVVISDSANATPQSSAMLDVQSTEKGFLPPRMTTSDRNAITSPANGLVVYDTEEESLFLYNGTGWLPLVTNNGNQWESNGGNIFRNTGNVGIGTSNPQYPLHLLGGVGVSWQVERTGGALLRGTANINEASIGTHNNTGLRLLTNNTVRMHVATDGKIGIGTTNPSARLHLAGDLRIQDGTHGAGKVLTSDAFGNATWSDVDIYGSSTIVVDASGNGNFLTITAALNSATPTAENPVTILIKPGTYFETVELKSHTTLLGEDENNVLITGWPGGTPGFGGDPYGILLNAVTNVQIRNLTVKSNSLSDPYLFYGALMIDSDAKFENVHILGDYNLGLVVNNGIKAENSKLELINGSLLELQDKAIQLVNSTAEVSNSNLSAAVINIEVENGSQLELTNSHIGGGGYGVSIENGGTANLIGNRFADIGVGIQNYGRLLMSGNHIRSTTLQGVSNYSNATITGNYFIDCVSAAINDFSPAGSTTITGNHIENSSHEGEKALIVNSDAVISSNVFYNNTFGDIAVGSIKPWLIGNNGSVSGNLHGIMAGIGDMRIEREGNNMLLQLPADGKVGIGAQNPSYRLSLVDNGVGIDRPAENELAFYTSGTERLRISNNGMIGIGGPPQSNRKLSFGNSGAAIDDQGGLSLYPSFGIVGLQISSLGAVSVGGGPHSSTKFTVFASGETGIHVSGSTAIRAIGSSIGMYASSSNTGLLVEGNNFSIYSSTGKIYSFGPVGIGTETPRGRLNISQNFGVTNASTIDDYPFMISYPSNATGQETGIAFRISVQQNTTQTPGAAITHLRTGGGSSGDLLFKTKSGDFEPVIERLRITSNGNIGIGTDTPGALLHVERTSSSSTPQFRIHNSSATGFARFRLTNDAHEHYWDIASGGTNNYLDFYHNGNGGSMMTLRPDLRFVGIRTINPTFTLHVNGDAGKPGGGSWANASDARLKSDVQDLQGSLENLLRLRGVTFIYNDPETIHELPGKRTGMIAQEVAEVFPDWVSEASDGYLRLTYRGFEALTVEAFRELKAEISRLSNENEKLKVEKDIEIARLSCRLHAIENLLSRIYQEQEILFSQND